MADVTRTPEFSPEILRCRWLDDASEAAVEHTQHMRSNYQMELAGDTAAVTHTLAQTEGGWRCTGMALAVTYARGNETVRTYQPES